MCLFLDDTGPDVMPSKWGGEADLYHTPDDQPTEFHDAEGYTVYVMPDGLAPPLGFRSGGIDDEVVPPTKDTDGSTAALQQAAATATAAFLAAAAEAAAALEAAARAASTQAAADAKCEGDRHGTGEGKGAEGERGTGASDHSAMRRRVSEQIKAAEHEGGDALKGAAGAAGAGPEAVASLMHRLLHDTASPGAGQGEAGACAQDVRKPRAPHARPHTCTNMM